MPDYINIPETTRLDSLNIPPSLTNKQPTVTYSGVSNLDKRVRIGMLPNTNKAIFYTDPKNILLSPLVDTHGVLFPYQPKIDIGFSANYQTQKVAQSNFSFHSYEQSEMKPIEVSGEFPIRNSLEGNYVVACITFLRSLTMMFTGNDKNPGSPPLVVALSGMGFTGLDTIPVVITNVNTSFADNVDYLSIPITGLNGEITRLPTIMNISVSCQPMFSRAFASAFSVESFSSGTTRLLGPNYSAPSK
jgi:hypothetical protein